MGLTIIGGDPIAIPIPFGAPILETRKTWSNSWAVQLDLELIYAGVVAGSANVSQCQVLRRYGNRKMPFENTFRPTSSEDLEGQWLRFSVMGERGPVVQFQGVFVGDNSFLEGTPTELQGEQTLVAYGGLHLLQRIDVGESFFTTPAGIVRIGWLPPMNVHDRRGLVVGNATHLSNPPTYGGTDLWSHFEYISYLIKYFIQKPSGPVWTIGGQTDVLKNLRTSIRFPDEAKVSTMLRELIPVKYGLDYQILPTDAGFEINVFSLTEKPAALGGQTLPANPNTVQIVRDRQLDMHRVKVVKTGERQVDRIVVQGKRIVVCGTLEGPSLVQKWSPALETEYVNLPDDASRQREKYRIVFQQLGAPAAWTLDSGVWAVKCDDNGNLTIGPYQTSRRETLHYIPLKEGFDYSTWPPTDHTDGQLLPDVKHPIAWIYDPTPPIGEPRYVACHQVGIHLELPYQDWGVLLNGTPNHIIALNHWPEGAQTEAEIKYDYASAIATIAIESDHRLRLAYTVPASMAAGDGSEEVVTDDNAECHVVLANTVFDVTATGGLERFEVQRVVRNDIDRLALLGCGLIARYVSGRYRAEIEWNGHKAWGTLIGRVLTEIRQGRMHQDVSAPITSVEWTTKPTPRTIVKAGYA